MSFWSVMPVQYSCSQFLLTLLDLCLCVCSVPLVTFVSAVHDVKTKKGLLYLPVACIPPTRNVTRVEWPGKEFKGNSSMCEAGRQACCCAQFTASESPPLPGLRVDTIGFNSFVYNLRFRKPSWDILLGVVNQAFPLSLWYIQLGFWTLRYCYMFSVTVANETIDSSPK
jgi:hypothetical protein